MEKVEIKEMTSSKALVLLLSWCCARRATCERFDGARGLFWYGNSSFGLVGYGNSSFVLVGRPPAHTYEPIDGGLGWNSFQAIDTSYQRGGFFKYMYDNFLCKDSATFWRPEQYAVDYGGTGPRTSFGLSGMRSEYDHVTELKRVHVFHENPYDGQAVVKMRSNAVQLKDGALRQWYRILFDMIGKYRKMKIVRAARSPSKPRPDECLNGGTLVYLWTMRVHLGRFVGMDAAGKERFANITYGKNSWGPNKKSCVLAQWMLLAGDVYATAVPRVREAGNAEGDGFYVRSAFCFYEKRASDEPVAIFVVDRRFAASTKFGPSVPLPSFDPDECLLCHNSDPGCTSQKCADAVLANLTLSGGNPAIRCGAPGKHNPEVKGCSSREGMVSIRTACLGLSTTCSFPFPDLDDQCGQRRQRLTLATKKCTSATSIPCSSVSNATLTSPPPVVPFTKVDADPVVGYCSEDMPAVVHPETSVLYMRDFTCPGMNGIKPKSYARFPVKYFRGPFKREDTPRTARCLGRKGFYYPAGQTCPFSEERFASVGTRAIYTAAVEEKKVSDLLRAHMAAERRRAMKLCNQATHRLVAKPYSLGDEQTIFPNVSEVRQVVLDLGNDLLSAAFLPSVVDGYCKEGLGPHNANGSDNVPFLYPDGWPMSAGESAFPTRPPAAELRTTTSGHLLSAAYGLIFDHGGGSSTGVDRRLNDTTTHILNVGPGRNLAFPTTAPREVAPAAEIRMNPSGGAIHSLNNRLIVDRATRLAPPVGRRLNDTIIHILNAVPATPAHGGVGMRVMYGSLGVVLLVGITLAILFGMSARPRLSRTNVKSDEIEFVGRN